ncbi:Xyloglucan endotransglucosylase/hydrolase [Melia azedarach]|uniref:Xyloglucan endotransglucosylase/hydrolase n=1 Tax=Melia azedarach TaxID=155640 RepID=A0ACC1YZ92_MELAZ|nr:Xyloglucan endotransglucosylase/hydrolase [Melia azedarach]
MNNSCISILSTFLLLVSPLQTSCRPDNTNFYDNYYVTWGHDHALLLNQGREIQLSLDRKSGSGFESKLRYGSGFFHIRMKLPAKNSTGVVTTFYLSSRSSHHDEIDIEFLGGPEYKLHTNIFTYGQGDREQQIHLWFDPTKHFHSYKILWNAHQIVIYVDNVPIRVFKNKIKEGASYPAAQAMQIMGSIWKEEGWSSGGNKIDWSQAPFQAHYQDFYIDGCVSKEDGGSCNSSRYWWNSRKYWRLNPKQEISYQNVRRKYLTYDYCRDNSTSRAQHLECYNS